MLPLLPIPLPASAASAPLSDPLPPCSHKAGLDPDPLPPCCKSHEGGLDPGLDPDPGPPPPCCESQEGGLDPGLDPPCRDTAGDPRVRSLGGAPEGVSGVGMGDDAITPMSPVMDGRRALSRVASGPRRSGSMRERKEAGSDPARRRANSITLVP